MAGDAFRWRKMNTEHRHRQLRAGASSVSQPDTRCAAFPRSLPGMRSRTHAFFFFFQLFISATNRVSLPSWQRLIMRGCIYWWSGDRRQGCGLRPSLRGEDAFCFFFFFSTAALPPLCVCQGLTGLSAPSAELSVCLSDYLPVCLSVYLPICLSARLLVCLPVCLSLCLSACLSLIINDPSLQTVLWESVVTSTLAFSVHLTQEKEQAFTHVHVHTHIQTCTHART